MGNKSVSSNMIWSIIERLSSQILYFIVSVILARIIDPDEYGVVTTVTVIVNIFSGAIQSGFSSALIYSDNNDKITYSTAFWSTTIICMIMYFILFFAAPLISNFYNNTDITLYIRIMSVQIIIQGFQSIPFAYISKNMLFKANYFATISGVIVSGLFSLVLAFNGFGIWALVFHTMTEVITSTVVLWMITQIKITFDFDRDTAKKMFNYCWKLMSVDMLNSFYSSLNSIIIGKKYNQSEVAYYNRGYNLPQTMLGSVNTAVSKVLFPVFTLSKEISRIRESLRITIRNINYIVYPMLFGMIAVSNEIVLVLYSNKWVGIIPYLQLMCIAWLFQPVQICVVQVFKATGKSAKYLRLEIVKKIFGFIYLVFAIYFFNDPLSLAFVLILGQITSTIANFRTLEKYYNYTIIDQTKDLFCSVTNCIIMLVFVILIGNLISNIYIRLVTKVIIGVIVYIGLSILLNNKQFFYVKNILFGGKKHS